MRLLLLCPLLAACAFGIVGCQTLPPQPIGIVVPIYARKAEAVAVAAGQFGAVPIAMAGEAEIESVLSVPCAGYAVAVQFRGSRRGWIPMESLPRKLLQSSGCSAETAN